MVIAAAAACNGGRSGAATTETGGTTDASGTGNATTTADAADCEVDPEFSSCEAPGGAEGLCLAGDCHAVQPCDAAGCAMGPTHPLADTLLAECYDANGAITCPGAAGAPSCADAPLCGQDAQYGWDSMNPREQRFELEDAAGAPVVTDRVTGLVWYGCVLGQGAGCAGQADRVPWEEARAFCEDASWGGHDDWVLPDVYQLHSLVDYSTTSPAIDRSVFQNSPSLVAENTDEWWIECQWSSTDVAGSSNAVWGVMVNSGDILTGSGLPWHEHDKAASGWEGCYARCVRRTEPPARKRHLLLDQGGEPVVADTIIARLWQGCSAGQSGSGCTGEPRTLSWPDALAYCEGLSWGGYEDWRLPNMMELGSLPDRSRFLPAIDPALFPNTPYFGSGPADDERWATYWSSTARWYQSFALYVDFSGGGSHFYRQEEGRHVRCVR
jgi:hypothetical protein